MTIRASCSRRLAAWSMVLVLAGILPAEAGGHWPLYRPHHPYWYAEHGGIYALSSRIAFTQAIPWLNPDFKAWSIYGDRYAIGMLNVTLPPPKWRWAVPCCYSRPGISIPALKTKQESVGSGGLQPLADTGKTQPPASQPGG